MYKILLYAIFLLTINIQSLAQNNSTFEQGLDIGKLDLKQDSLAVTNALNGWWTASQKILDQRMSWFNDAKFGCFVHWGVYSAFGGKWDNSSSISGYGEHLMRHFQIPIVEYKKKVVKSFNPIKFDADKWMKQVHDAGMRYFVITSKHHDGFAMFYSDAYPYDIRLTLYGKDPMLELRKAATKYGIKFGFYYSHAFDWEHLEAPGNDWDYKDHPGGDKNIGGHSWWNTMPGYTNNTQKYLEEKALPQLKELIEKYHPDILWFDTPHKLPLYQNLEVLEYIRKLDPNIIVNGRLVNYNNKFGAFNFGDYTNTADRPAYLLKPKAKYWECIPTTNESYGYNKYDNQYKSPSFFIRLLATATFKGGNMLMNVGPMGNGEWNDKDIAIFNAIGNWLKKNGEAIYGNNATLLPVQNWGVVTQKNNHLYLHIFRWPKNKKLIVNGLKAASTSAILLANKIALNTKQLNENEFQLTLPLTAPDTSDAVVRLTVKDGYKITDSSYLLSDENYLLAFDATLKGEGFEYGDGKTNRQYISNWKNASQSICWQVRNDTSDTFDVRLEYNTVNSTDSGEIVVSIDNIPYKTSYGGYTESQGVKKIDITKIKLEKGTHTIELKGVTIISGTTYLRPTALKINKR